MTLSKTNKYVLIDLPNTLFDSRQRTMLDTCYMLNIDNDTTNYTAYLLMKHFAQQGYKIVATHYCLSRLRPKIEQKLRRHFLQDYIYKLFVNFQTQDVFDSQSLKKHVYETTLSNVDVAYVIDNDPKMLSYWLSNDAPLLQVPLSI